jgi:hypothetical protein
MKCPLCSNESLPSIIQTFDCSHCGLKFKDPNILLSNKEESDRYQTHQNNPDDQGYKNFLNKLIIPLEKFLSKETFLSLDFGCGPGPTVSLLLEKFGADTYDYDPLFFPKNELLKPFLYDVVTSTEVVEHFHHPKADWQLLTSLVKSGGLLGIMTQFLKPETDYAKWWYKNDPTHVVFYTEKTFDYLSEYYGLEKVFCDEISVIIFRKR